MGFNKLLYIVNESTNGKSHSFDSGVFIASKVGEELYRRGVDVFFVGSSAFCSKKRKNRCFSLLHNVNKFSVRFDFDYDGFRSVLKRVKPDVIFVNQVEQAAGVYVCAVSDLHLESSIFSYIHYTPVYHILEDTILWDKSLNSHNIAPIIFSRHLEAVHVSKLVFLPSAFSKTLFIDAIKISGSEVEFDKLKVLYPPIDLRDIERIRESIARPPDDVFNVIYNHRLYDHYGTKYIISLLDSYYNTLDSDEKKRFKVYVTAPGLSGRTKEQNKHDNSPIRNLKELKKRPYVDVRLNLRKEDYYRLIGQCHAGLAPLRPNAVWSISIVEVFAFGRPVVAPSFAVFPEMSRFGNIFLFDVSLSMKNGNLNIDVDPEKFRVAMDKAWEMSYRTKVYHSIRELDITVYVDKLLKNFTGDNDG